MKSVFYKGSLVLACCFCLTLQSLYGQDVRVGTPWTGAPGITLTVAQIMAMQDSLGPFQIQTTKETEEENHPAMHDNPDAPLIGSFPVPGNLHSYNEGNDGRTATQTIGANFLVSDIGMTVGYVPPDCNGDISATQVLGVANGRIRVFSKSGTLGALDVTTDVFFASVRGSSSISDTHIRYDRLTGKWFVVAINVASADNVVCLAVSNTSTLTATSSFTFFSFVFSTVSTTGHAGDFCDYPTLGVDANALYIGGNIFSPSFVGTDIFVVKKSSVTGAGPIVVTAFRTVGSSSSGMYTPQGVQNDDPNATEGYFIGADAGFYSTLNIIRISNPGGTPTMTSLTALTTVSTTSPLKQHALGEASGTRRLDFDDHRLFAAMIMKNKLTGVSTLWTAQTTGVNSSGIASSATRNAGRWYEIGSMTGTPTILQTGTLYDGAASNPRGFWFPSIAMSGQGHAVLGCSTAGLANHADVAIAGRYYGDASGTLNTFVLATSSSTAYNAQAVDGQRWGDFSQVTVDPTDDMTLWTFQEYCDAANSWGLRAVQLLAPAPPPTASLNALPTVGHTSSTTVNVVANSTPNNTGFYDPGADAGGPGYANHISSSANGGIVINSTTFLDATHVNIDLNTMATSSGTYTITITNPDGQSTTIPITVNAALPVELLSFEATPLADVVDLRWETASEQNTDYFSVERSADAVQFVPFQTVKAAGTSASPLRYETTDERPVSGLTYYRLEETDLNGQHSFSPVVSVHYSGDELQLLHAGVNETGNQLQLVWVSPADEVVTYQISDLLGRIIQQGSLEVTEGKGQSGLAIPVLSQGMYFISLRQKNGVTGTKFLH